MMITTTVNRQMTPTTPPVTTPATNSRTTGASHLGSRGGSRFGGCSRVSMRKSTAPRPMVLPPILRIMAKKWVLDTETKGTGAEMVPLEKILRDPSRPSDHELARVRLGSSERREAPAPAERQPPRFKVVDIRSREVLAAE